MTSEGQEMLVTKKVDPKDEGEGINFTRRAVNT
jgi:hypothetical protein